MIIVLLIVFLLLSFLSMFKIENKYIEIFVLLFCTLFLILIAGFRGEGFDRDYLNYKEMFLFLDKNSTYFVEPGFILIRNFTRIFLPTPVLLFLVFAILGVSIKAYSIIKLSDYVFLSFLIYFSNIFILHDLTQIRAGIASGLMLLSLIPLQAKKNYQFFIVALLAVFFHYTALVLLLIWFLSTEKINKKVWYLIIPISYILLYLSISPLDFYKLIPIDAIQAKVRTYILLQEANEDDKVNVISTLVILRIFIIIYILKNIDIIQSINKYSIILIKIYIISISVLIIMSKTTAIALRFNEFFLTIEIVALPLVLYTVQPRFRIIPRVLLIVFSAILLFFHFRSKTLLIFE